MQRHVFASLPFVLALAACSSGNDATPQPDASSPADASIGGEAAAPQPDAGNDAASPTDANANDANEAAPPYDAGPVPVLTCADVTGAPPPDPNGPAPTTSARVVFAVDSWQLGDGPTGNEWQPLGFDVDHAVTDASGAGACTPFTGGSKARNVDGCHGIDNAFGDNVMQSIFSALVANPSQVASDDAQTGRATMLVAIDGLPSPLATTSKIHAAIYGAGAFGATPPKFDGTDVWPIDEATVSGDDVTKPLLTFDSGYVTGNTFVSGPSTGETSLYVGGDDMIVPLTHVVLELDLSADGKSVTRGALSAVVPTEHFVDDLHAVAGNISTSLCTGTAFDQIAATIRAAQDILPDGTNASGATCGAISLGFGFTAKVDRMATTTTSIRPADACGTSDAGTD